MAKFKVDENLPVEVAELLRGAGHDAVTIAQQSMVGYPDDAVADACRREGRAIVTLDQDFADIRAYSPSDYSGIVVLRLWRSDKPLVISIMHRLLLLLEKEPLRGKLWIVDGASVRIRS